MSRTVRDLTLLLDVTVLGLPSAATAATWVGRDPAGDVVRTEFTSLDGCPAVTWEDAPDATSPHLRRVRVRHAGHADRIVTRYRHLAPSRDQTVFTEIRTPAGTWLLWTSRSRLAFGGAVHSTLYKKPRKPPADRCTPVRLKSRDCDVDATVDVRRGTLHAQVPRACLRTPRWVRVGVGVTEVVPSSGDVTVNFGDTWGPDGDSVALSPRIPARAGRVG